MCAAKSQKGHVNKILTMQFMIGPLRTQSLSYAAIDWFRLEILR